jgi:hypothetical protein
MKIEYLKKKLGRPNYNFLETLKFKAQKYVAQKRKKALYKCTKFSPFFQKR